MHEPPLRGLIFDMGDVLFDATAWRRWLAADLARITPGVTYEAVVARWEDLLRDVYAGRAEYWMKFDELLHSFGVPALERAKLTHAAREMAVAVKQNRSLFDGVEATLRSLKSRGRRLAVLTDTEAGEELVRGMLATLGIEDCFDAIVTSCDIGFPKPAPEAYHAAVSALDLEARVCGFVGHDDEELAGARAAGLTAIAFNAAPPVSHDVWLESFQDLLGL